MSDTPIFDKLNAEMDYIGKMQDARKMSSRFFPLPLSSYTRKADIDWAIRKDEPRTMDLDLSNAFGKTPSTEDTFDQTARTLLEEAPCRSEDPSAAFKCFREDTEPEMKPVVKTEINDLCLDATGTDYENVLGEFITSMKNDFLRDHPYAVVEEVSISHELDGSSKFVIKGLEPVTTPHVYTPLFEMKESDEE